MALAPPFLGNAINGMLSSSWSISQLGNFSTIVEEEETESPKTWFRKSSSQHLSSSALSKDSSWSVDVLEDETSFAARLSPTCVSATAAATMSYNDKVLELQWFLLQTMDNIAVAQDEELWYQ